MISITVRTVICSSVQHLLSMPPTDDNKVKLIPRSCITGDTKTSSCKLVQETYYWLYQGVRVEGAETLVSTLYTNCYSDSSLPILLLVLPDLKSTALCNLKNICPLM